MSLVGVTHYGDLGASFNRLLRLRWCELQPGIPQCTPLGEDALSRVSTRDAPVYAAWRGCIVASFNRGCPSVHRLERMHCREFQSGMPQCTPLGEDALSRVSTGDAPVYTAWRGCIVPSFNRGCPSTALRSAHRG
ncbi:hypothetical protein CDL15_Pgr011152 [Punica granatum]|uniref:Uncharacterized protein n=1 Tax=Punica granatum TaxID=22663 RepID=A0A218X010_PUNGR|nr:hypothetical protein CDL15_Pgr011152 [Punica granatum]